MKVQLPWFGKAAGRSAGTIYQSYFDNTYTRTMPFSFHYPDTKNQQKTQASFFDIQRNWFPIYNEISLNIKKQQRYDKNVFNRLSKAVYRVLNPYAKKFNEKPQRFFGLEPRNENRATIAELQINFRDAMINIFFDMQQPYWNRTEQIESSHLLVFNRTQQTMMYQQTKFLAGFNNIVFLNIMHWSETDDILIYIAIASENYLANFNLVN